MNGEHEREDNRHRGWRETSRGPLKEKIWRRQEQNLNR
jgi:hypothetical protein